MMEESYGFDWKKLFVLGILVLLAGATYYVNYTESGAMKWDNYWNPPQTEQKTVEIHINDTPSITYKVNENGVVKTTTEKPGDEFSLVDGIYVQTKKTTSASISSIEVVVPKETSEWTNPDGMNFAEKQTIGSIVLDINSAPAQTRSALSWTSLKAAKDEFIKAFGADQKEGNFGDYLKRTSSIWGGDDVLSWSNSDGYVAYLVKYSNTEYFLWEITPTYATGNYPTDKNDLKKIQYGSSVSTSNQKSSEDQKSSTDSGATSLNSNSGNRFIPASATTNAPTTGNRFIH